MTSSVIMDEELLTKDQVNVRVNVFEHRNMTGPFLTYPYGINRLVLLL